VVSVADQVATVGVERHLVRPSPIGIPGRAADVIDGGRPRRVIGLIVLRPERLQHEPVVARRRGGIGIWGDEGALRHGARLDDAVGTMSGPMDAAALWSTFARHQQLVYARGRSRCVRSGPRWWAVVTGETHPDLNLCGLTSAATVSDARDMTET